MRRIILLTAITLVFAAGCAEKAFEMGSDVMAPAIRAGDRVVVNRSAYINEGPRRGDAVLYRIPDTDVERTSILRVVAVGGDTLRVADGKLYVNDMDSPVTEPYVRESMKYELDETTVPNGHVYVLGDNRNDSNDSHRLGPLPAENVLGQVVQVKKN